MKKIFIILILITAFIACKNNTKSESTDQATEISGEERTAKQSDGLTLLKGEFIYYSDAAVLQTHRQMYGVVIDEKMHELDDLAKAFKNEVTDFVQVEIRGRITPKPENEEGWDYRVEIKEILNVEASKESNEVVKLGTE